MKNPGKITRENILYHRNIDSYSISSVIAFRWPGVQYQMISQKSQYLCGFAGFSGWKIKKQKSQNTSFQKIFHRRYDPRWSGAEVPSSRPAPLDFSEYH